MSYLIPDQLLSEKIWERSSDFIRIKNLNPAKPRQMDGGISGKYLCTTQQALGGHNAFNSWWYSKEEFSTTVRGMEKSLLFRQKG